MTDVKLSEFAEKMSRMCRNYSTCDACPLEPYSCHMTFLDNLNDIVGIVCDWCEEHPIKKYSVQLVKYFNVEVEAEDEERAISIADELTEDWDFNEGLDDREVSQISN